MLKIADNLSLPLEVVTQTVGILAKRRAGKSFTARRITEQIFRARQQVVIVDPKGDWWGIRSSADGKEPGLAIPILGGGHGDIRLEVGAGEIVAKMAVEEGVSLLLDLSEFRKHEVATFMTAFLETLYRLKARDEYRTAMMLMIDEADAIAPQKPQHGEERMLGAAEDIVRRGGQRGIGCTMITQRSAVLNKNVLTQIQILIGMRTIAPQDIEAVKAWIDVHGTVEQRKVLMESLPALPTGDAWFWSPGWPHEDGIFKRVHVLPIETFDSGATPRPGEHRVEAKTLADVDLKAFEKRMAATIERAKADDPRELRRQIADLKKQAAAKPTIEADAQAITHAVAQALAVQRRDFQATADHCRKAITRVQGVLGGLSKKLIELADEITSRGDGAIDALFNAFDSLNAGKPSTAFTIPDAGVAQRQEQRIRNAPVARSSRAASSNGAGPADSSLGGPQRKILTVLAQAGRTCDKRFVALRSGYAINGGAFNNPIGALRSLGYVTKGWPMEITQEGVDALGEWEPLPTGSELLNYWLEHLPGPQRKILSVIIEQRRGIDKESLAEAAGYAADGGAFNNPIGSLRTLQLVTRGWPIRPSEELFD